MRRSHVPGHHARVLARIIAGYPRSRLGASESESLIGVLLGQNNGSGVPCNTTRGQDMFHNTTTSISKIKSE